MSGPITIPKEIEKVHCNIVQTKELQLLWGGTRKTKLPNDEIKECEKVFQTHTRSSDGSFVVNIPFKYPTIKLPPTKQSRAVAFKRFKNLEERFCKNNMYKQKYIEYMREFEQSGHMIKYKSNEDPDCTKSVNYLPHHAVLTLHKTTPLCSSYG